MFPAVTRRLPLRRCLSTIPSGFEILSTKRIPEFDLEAALLKHSKTNARILAVDKPDTNNVFNLTFKTVPTDSTGVPHILEHTALCGSRKFPVRDPFFKMLNRSMATFMNAMTAHDYTMYPFSTENPKDFRNLMDVYMDACLEPRLERLDFKQEGWRLEHENPRVSDMADTTSPIVFKGVVYNEMKGALADVNSLFYTRFQQALFPGSAYDHVSGGDPPAITDLTHAQLRAFHAKNYHPSRSLFYLYGNFPLADHLNVLSDRLSQFSAQPAESLSEYVGSNLAKERRVTVSGPPDPLAGALDEQLRLSITYNTCSHKDLPECLAIKVLSSLLIDGAGSPIFKALIESHLGSEYSVNTGFDNSTDICTVSFGLQGIKRQNLKLVEEEIAKALEKVASEGFPQARIDNIVHQMELGMKHRNANFGMNLGMSMSSHWARDHDLMEAIDIPRTLSLLKKYASQPGFFESKLRQYFLDDPTRLIFTMEPEPQFAKSLETEETERLQQKISSLKDAEKKVIVEDGLALAQKQDEKEDISVLPTLSINDILKNGKTYPLETKTIADVPVSYRATSTNGVSYFKMALSVDHIPSDLKIYLPLYCQALAALNTEKNPLDKLDEKIRQSTGGISASVFASSTPDDLHGIQSAILISSNCLDGNMTKMYSLVTEIMRETQWSDIQHLKTVVSGSAMDMMNSLAQSGHSYAMRFASSKLSTSQHLNEIFGGITQIQFMNQFAAADDDTLTKLSQKLKQIDALIRQASMRIAVNAESAVQDAHAKCLSEVVATMKASQVMEMVNAPLSPSQKDVKTFFSVPFAVNYTGKSYLGVPYTHADGPALQVLGHLMTNHFLHREIREKGGAYGGRCSYSPLSGTLEMMSYRDPQVLRTVQTFESAVEWASSIKNSVNNVEMDEAKLNIFQKIDKPVNASGEGASLFLNGLMDEMKQARRDKIFAVTLDDVQRVVDRYLRSKASALTVIGNAAEVKSLEGWEVVQLQ